VLVVDGENSGLQIQISGRAMRATMSLGFATNERIGPTTTLASSTANSFQAEPLAVRNRSFAAQKLRCIAKR
jgi:hypothetical protein